MLLRRILAQKGMQGEPTVAKCKEIRRELQAKRESAELDKSVIINAEGNANYLIVSVLILKFIIQDVHEDLLEMQLRFRMQRSLILIDDRLCNLKLFKHYQK